MQVNDIQTDPERKLQVFSDDGCVSLLTDLRRTFPSVTRGIPVSLYETLFLGIAETGQPRAAFENYRG